MISVLAGFLTGMLLIAISIRSISPDASIYFDIASIAIVLGGTVCAAIMTFSFAKTIGIVRIVLATMQKSSDDLQPLAQEIVKLSHETGGERALLKEKIASVQYPFLRDGLNLIVDKVAPARASAVMKDRIKTVRENYTGQVVMLKTLAKYPPAFGMIGTVIGLVATLQGLGTEDAMKNIGPSMAVGLMTTLYGLITAYLLFVPLSDNLVQKSENDLRKRELVMAAVLLLIQRESPVTIQEALNALLPPAQQFDLLGTGGADSGEGSE